MTIEKKLQRRILNQRCGYCYGEAVKLTVLIVDNTAVMYVTCIDEECNAKQQEERKKRFKEEGKEFDENLIYPLMRFEVPVEAVLSNTKIFDNNGSN